MLTLPQLSPDHPPLLFVHGSWHSSWCWQPFLSYFRERGFPAFAMDLPDHPSEGGRGGAVRWKRLRDYKNAVEQAIEELPDRLKAEGVPVRPPVLIGHSLGSLLVGLCLESHPEITRAALLAPIPRRGALPATLRILGSNRWTRVIKSLLTFNTYPIVETPGLTRRAFFPPDIPEEELIACWQRLGDESIWAFFASLRPDLLHPERVQAKLLIQGGSRDTIVLPSDIKATANCYGAALHLYPNSAHDLMLGPGSELVAADLLAFISAEANPLA